MKNVGTTARAGKKARGQVVRALLLAAFDAASKEEGIEDSFSEPLNLGGITAQAAAELAGISRPSVVAAREKLAPVLRKGTGPAATQTLAFDASLGAAFGVEIGHRHLAVGILDLSGQLVEDVRYVAKEVDEDPGTTLERIAACIDGLLEKRDLTDADVLGVGVSLAHPIDLRREGAVRALSTVDDRPWQTWQELGDIRQQLRQELGWTRLGVNRFVIDNDANLSAVTEQRWGAGRNLRHFLYVRWSDGIGGGLVLNGEVYRGADGLAGAIGHTPLPGLENPEKCPRCGLLGCLETVASRRRILASAGVEDTPGAMRLLVEEAAADEESLARRVLDQAAFQVGRAIGCYLHALNPEAVIIGGSVGAEVFDLVKRGGLEAGLRRQAVPAALEDVNLGGVHRSRFVRQSALRGAAATVLWRFLPEFVETRI